MHSKKDRHPTKLNRRKFGKPSQSFSAVHNCSSYKFNTSPKTWKKSQEECKKENGNLISMETIAEWEFIKTKLEQFNRSQEWFIGLSCHSGCKENNQWEWVSGKSLNWKDEDLPWQNKPNGNENYAKVWKKPHNNKYVFDDVSNNDAPVGHICEYPNGKCKNV